MPADKLLSASVSDTVKYIVPSPLHPHINIYPPISIPMDFSPSLSHPYNIISIPFP